VRPQKGLPPSTKHPLKERYLVNLKVNAKRIGALVLVLFASASAQESQGEKLRNRHDTFAIFNRILRAFYPEIWHKAHELSLLDDFTLCISSRGPLQN